MIKCLPAEVQGKLRTGVAIPSLQQCLEELILNSIDAGATCVGVRVDMEAFKVQVIDNGAGMNKEDMECVGNRYHTSKCSSSEDLDNLKWYGFRGEALASIVSLASIVEISSRTKTSVKTHVKVFKDGKGLNVFEAETSRPSPGTTVIICNFFHNMPVRRNRLDTVLEGERIRHRFEAISLMYPSVSFTLKNDCTGVMMIQLPKASSTYYRFIQIHNQARAEKLGEISYTHKQFDLKGYLGKEGHYNNSLQFVYVNERLVLKTRIHKLLNLLLRRISSSNQKNDSPDGHSRTRSPKQKRNNELHGAYIINIKCSYSEYDVCLEPAKTLIEFKDWEGVLQCVREAVNTFLKREYLMFSQEDLDCVSPKVFCTGRTDQVEDDDKTNQTNLTTSALDSSLGTKLASHFVHRKTSDTGDQPEPSLMVCEPEQVVHEKTCKESEKNSQTFMAPAFFDVHDEKDSGSDREDKGSEVFNMSDEQEFTQLKEQETKLSGEISPVLKLFLPAQANLDIGEQILSPVDTRCEQTLSGNKKICLFDSYIHKSLQSRERCLDRQPVFMKPNPAAKCVKISAKSKHKLSLEAIQKSYTVELCKSFDPAISSKISRVSSCQKMSAGTELGSLDKFRRAYGKLDQIKVKPCHLQNNARRPGRNRFQTFITKEEYPKIDFQKMQERKEKQSCIQTLQTDKNANRSKISLASKLFHLKQNKAENAEVSVQISSYPPNDDSVHCMKGGNQDGNENVNSKDIVMHNESVSGTDIKLQTAGNEEGSTSSDWLHHYDTSVGKTVYVNRMTGLSRYEDPSKEETRVQCTSDVTNLAVDVISEMGMEYRCYPFQMDLVLPFLPKSRPERVISSGTDWKDYGGESFNSLSSLYSKWNNPVFVRPPTVGLDISSGQADGLVVKIHNVLFPYRFSKAMIHSMKVIHQVDKKFLACLINTRDQESTAQIGTEGNLLVLVDQHAAHERVRLENLISDSYEEDPNFPGEKRLCSSTIIPPLEIGISEEELRLLRSCQLYLRSLGLEVSFSHGATPQVLVGKVPLCFMEKESNEQRRGRPSVIKAIVEEYLQEQIELLRCTGRVRGTLPLTVLKVLASLACHGAIKFNDTLSRDECCSLVASLSSCQLPFQCAHGRPSIAPLVDIFHLDNDEKDSQKPNLKRLRRMYKAWQLFGNK